MTLSDHDRVSIYVTGIIIVASMWAFVNTMTIMTGIVHVVGVLIVITIAVFVSHRRLGCHNPSPLIAGVVRVSMASPSTVAAFLFDNYSWSCRSVLLLFGKCNASV